jgi:hypothetical protein
MLVDEREVAHHLLVVDDAEALGSPVVEGARLGTALHHLDRLAREALDLPRPLVLERGRTHHQGARDLGVLA